MTVRTGSYAKIEFPPTIGHDQVESGKPVVVFLRPGKTPPGREVRAVLKHLVRRIRGQWPRTRIIFRGDSHYGRPEAMAWCEDDGVDYIFALLSGNGRLDALAAAVADDLKVRRAEAAKSIRLALRTSSMVATRRPSFSRCVLRWPGKRRPRSSMIPCERCLIPLIAPIPPDKERRNP